jgi:hypothetical protein
MNIKVIAQQNQSVGILAYFQPLADSVGQASAMLRSIGKALLGALDESRSVQATRFIHAHRHLIDS